MTKLRKKYICQNCGSVHHRWAGKCDDCKSWNSLIEEKSEQGIGSSPSGKSHIKGQLIEFLSFTGDCDPVPRIESHIYELDRVSGGGFVRGSVTLIGGEPGIGKSTLLTQTAASIAQLGHKVIYISGEEAVEQIRLRSQRLQLQDCNVELAAETNVENILTTLQNTKNIDLVIIDSIQTLWTYAADSAPGTVTQVRLSVQAFINYAKHNNVAIIFVGHVTKEGQIAGPRVVEHMVDSVLYFEGSQNHHYRILRGIKNRFGATNEIGVFEMSQTGLQEVANPSALFLTDPHHRVSGSAVFAGIEGTRVLLVEIQALVMPSTLAMPRRAVVGWDQQRLAMILAVLEAHCGIKLSQYDVYLNVSGGYRIQEPAADLAVVAALTSSFYNTILPAYCVYFGEISLAGSLRTVAQSNQRIKEAEKLGFKQIVLSPSKDCQSFEGVQLTFIHTLQEVIQRISKRRTQSSVQ